MATYKLVVEVISARNLMQNYGQGSARVCVELDFDGQRFCTTIKENGPNPVWSERFYFNVPNMSNTQKLALEACVYNVSKSKGAKSFLGSVRISDTSFVLSSDAVVMHYPLEKRGIFSWRVEGELGLKVYIADVASLRDSTMDSLTCSRDFHVSNNLESILQSQSSTPRGIPFQHLKKITNDFSNERILGQGGFGVVYKGVLENGEIIAVKKIMSSLMPGLQKQFENEVYHLMILKHRNIVRCLGYCYEIQNALLQHNGKYVFEETAERLLCLEYLPNGSLDKYLSDESSGLDWSTRYKIIMGICYGLCHLHEQIYKPIIHLDLKPSNILLDDQMDPKITDFGLSRLVDQEQTICTSSRDGTFGYMAPEFLHGGTITPKSDIFSLGVIILEVITGHREYVDVTKTSPDDFIDLALKKWRNTLERAPGYRSVETECQQIKTCIQVGLICVNPERRQRPPITEIINMLQGPECFESNGVAVSIDSDMLRYLPKLSHQEVQVACKDFTNIIDSAPGTVVYKGVMRDGREIFVISFNAEGHWTCQHEIFYQNKVIVLSKLNHENTATFLGYCSESEPFYRMVIIEYSSNGTLYEHLHDGEAAQMFWHRRIKIAIGIAQGLRYLHTELQAPIAMSELNSSSVYITEDFTPKLVDFESWKMLFSKHEKVLDFSGNKASLHGRDSSEDKHANIEDNIFAFGVILLEIISGRLPYCKDKGYLVEWAIKYLQQPEEFEKLVDPELTNVGTEDLAVICSMVSRCIDPDPSKRPSMRIIAGALETGIDQSMAPIIKDPSMAWAWAQLGLLL